MVGIFMFNVLITALCKDDIKETLENSFSNSYNFIFKEDNYANDLKTADIIG